jgi:hypothetical protein
MNYSNKLCSRNTRLTLTGSALLLTMLASTPTNALTIGGGGDPVPVDFAATFDLAANPATAATTYVVNAGSAKFAKVKKVAIWHYCMRFITNKGASGRSSGATISFNSSVEGGFPGGLAEMAAKTVADAYYDQLEADLRTAGLEVIPIAQLETTAAFQKSSKSWTEDAKYDDEAVDMGNRKGVSGEQQFAMLSAHGRKFDADCALAKLGNQMNIARASSDPMLKDVTMIAVTTTMDYATLMARGGFFSGAKADMTYGQHLVPGPTSTFIDFRGGTNVKFWLKQAIVPKDNPFAEGNKGERETRTEKENEDNPDSATITTSSQGTAVSGDTALWQSNAESHLKALSAMFVAKVKQAQ